MIAGSEPIIMGEYRIEPHEMMFIQYLPIRMPGSDIRLPKNVECFRPLIDAACFDYYPSQYVYLTAKRMYVDPHRNLNRPGWHTDGFGTNDVNYVWSDHAPTEFCIQTFFLSDDCDESLSQMEAQAKQENIRTYGENTLLRLDSSVVHRVAPNPDAGFRTFAKISISNDRYNLEGNAHNYLFDYEWEMMRRGEKRNHPHQ